jgi:SAM-dependent methyltransferase
MAVPDRIAWALGLLAPSAGERVLEIGCGRGVAAGLLTEAGCKVTALDRSATAIAAARARSPHAAFVCAPLLQAELEPSAYDAVLAINVNLFWLDAARGLTRVRQLLSPGGRLLLAYDPPGQDQIEAIAAKLAAHLAAAGFTCALTRGVTASGSPLLAALGRP